MITVTALAANGQRDIFGTLTSNKVSYSCSGILGTALGSLSSAMMRSTAIFVANGKVTMPSPLTSSNPCNRLGAEATKRPDWSEYKSQRSSATKMPPSSISLRAKSDLPDPHAPRISKPLPSKETTVAWRLVSLTIGAREKANE